MQNYVSSKKKSEQAGELIGWLNIGKLENNFSNFKFP